MAYMTRISMLRGVHEHDEHSWEEFQAFYTPLIFFYGWLPHQLVLPLHTLEDPDIEISVRIT